MNYGRSGTLAARGPGLCLYTSAVPSSFASSSSSVFLGRQSALTMVLLVRISRNRQAVRLSCADGKEARLLEQAGRVMIGRCRLFCVRRLDAGLNGATLLSLRAANNRRLAFPLQRSQPWRLRPEGQGDGWQRQVGRETSCDGGEDKRLHHHHMGRRRPTRQSG